MLDTDTKRRIDTARDILVGKVPDPKSQVEQITIALIYKFMDDMDAESEEFGGKRKFFAKEFARYGWAKLMHSGLGGHETLNLYGEAISKMPENPGIPLLFRNIFKNAYLPYRDPETLRAFLKVIDEFSYDHSERLGDAFEYLLSVLGSQGDAGQFRTPRHIIDFMVEIIDPKKKETVLDPACGTAGFLISSYKHILKANTNAKGHSTLTPDDKGRLAKNFKGYDISPDMVRLSLVNLYLHGFTDPHIFEYDTLTSQDRWNEYADVILANPPFMSPKGGIKPHKRFSVQSKRSEVLFVDYMAEHLTPNGRAGIIVPEGIIFQSQTAYKDLRKLLVENYLVAVVSLPAGVFNPYSGVKTSILVLDKSLAKKANTIAFFKIENDGFGLGAQRREIDKNDLPQAQAEIGDYLSYLRAGKSGSDFQSTLGLIVKKEKIEANGECNLSGERYREKDARESRFPIVDLGAIADFSGGYAFKSEDMADAPLDTTYRPVVKIGNVGRDGLLNLTNAQYHAFAKDLDRFSICVGDIVIAMTGATVEKVAEVDKNNLLLNQRVGVIRAKPKALQKYLLVLLQRPEFYEFCQTTSGGGAQGNIAPKEILEYQIPLPPLDVQKEIVAEIEGYQKVINGARAVLDNYRPHIPVDPSWPMALVGDVVEFVSGLTVSIPEVEAEGGTPIIAINNVTEDGNLTLDGLRRIKPPKKTLNYVQKGDLLFNWRNGSKHLVGKTARFDLEGQYLFASFLLGIRPHSGQVDSSYLWHTLNIYRREGRYLQFMRQNVNGLFNREELKMVKISLPSLVIQKQIVEEIEAEQALITANRDLIVRFEKKIQATLARVWGEDEKP